MEIFLYFAGTTLLGFILGKYDCKSTDEINPIAPIMPEYSRTTAEEVALREKCISLEFENGRLRHMIYHLEKEYR